MEKPSFEITITQESLNLLLNDKPDIRTEILHQLQQGDPSLDDVGEEICDICEDNGVSEKKIDKVMEKFAEDSIENLMKYVSYNESDISFDYSEAACYSDRNLCAFKIPCSFDLDAYLKEAK